MAPQVATTTSQMNTVHWAIVISGFSVSTLRSSEEKELTAKHSYYTPKYLRVCPRTGIWERPLKELQSLRSVCEEFLSSVSLADTIGGRTVRRRLSNILAFVHRFTFSSASAPVTMERFFSLGNGRQTNCCSKCNDRLQTAERPSKCVRGMPPGELSICIAAGECSSAAAGSGDESTEGGLLFYHPLHDETGSQTAARRRTMPDREPREENNR
ncbi:hypothetical protein V8E54_014378 [Elaphomyces granulatus]